MRQPRGEASRQAALSGPKRSISKEVGRQLGVSYVLEGYVRNASGEDRQSDGRAYGQNGQLMPRRVPGCRSDGRLITLDVRRNYVSLGAATASLQPRGSFVIPPERDLSGDKVARRYWRHRAIHHATVARFRSEAAKDRQCRSAICRSPGRRTPTLHRCCRFLGGSRNRRRCPRSDRSHRYPGQRCRDHHAHRYDRGFRNGDWDVYGEGGRSCHAGERGRKHHNHRFGNSYRWQPRPRCL